MIIDHNWVIGIVISARFYSTAGTKIMVLKDGGIYWRSAVFLVVM